MDGFRPGTPIWVRRNVFSPGLVANVRKVPRRETSLTPLLTKSGREFNVEAHPRKPMPVNWGAIGAVAGVLGLLGLVYQLKHSQLDTRRERESYIKKRFQGRGWDAPHLTFEVDDVTIEERTGRRYRAKRWALRPLEGSTVIAVKSSQMFADDVLGSRLLDEVGAGAGVDVEFVDSRTGGDPPVLLFRVDSVEHEDIMPVVAKLTETLSAWRESKYKQFTRFDPDELRQVLAHSIDGQSDGAHPTSQT